MEPPNRPPSRHSNEYYIKAQSSEWWGRAGPVEPSPHNEHNELAQKQRRNTIQSEAHPVTVPTGQTGQRQFTKQNHQYPDHSANLALRYHRGAGAEQRPRSQTVYEPGRAHAGQSVTTTVPAPISRMRHPRRGSNTTAGVTSPLMNPNPPSSSTSGRVGSSRPKRRDIPDTPRHANRTSRSQSAMMTAATTHLTMDTNPMWNSPPLLDGRGMRGYSVSLLGSETQAGHASYQYDTGRAQLTYQTAPEAAGAGFSGVPANGGRLNQEIGAVSMVPYGSRAGIGLAGSLERSPASGADRHLDAQLYSQTQHGDHYGHIASRSQYQERFDYGHLAQPPHVESIPGNLQGQQHPDIMYAADPHARYYSSHSHSPASPRLHLSSQHAMYPQYSTAPGITLNPFSAAVDDIAKLSQQVSYIPQQNHLLQSPLPAVSSPSEMSEPPERRSPTLQNRARVPGQRVDVDSRLIECSFRGGDDQSRVRRQVLNDIQQQSWFHLNQDEPKIDVHLHRDILKHGLGMVGRSIYTVFLAEDKDSNQWRCLFGTEEVQCKKMEKRFERVERAIEHVRSHLGHRPYACDGTCHKAKSAGTNCGKRFFAAGYLEDHKKRPQKRQNVS